jgi:hypothetical protein
LKGIVPGRFKGFGGLVEARSIADWRSDGTPQIEAAILAEFCINGVARPTVRANLGKRFSAVLAETRVVWINEGAVQAFHRVIIIGLLYQFCLLFIIAGCVSIFGGMRENRGKLYW